MFHILLQLTKTGRNSVPTENTQGELESPCVEDNYEPVVDVDRSKSNAYYKAPGGTPGNAKVRYFQISITLYKSSTCLQRQESCKSAVIQCYVTLYRKIMFALRRRVGENRRTDYYSSFVLESQQLILNELAIIELASLGRLSQPITQSYEQRLCPCCALWCPQM